MGLSQSFYNKVYFVLYLSWIVGYLADNNRFSSSRILRPP